jgi:hypothetical protein
VVTGRLTVVPPSVSSRCRLLQSPEPQPSVCASQRAVDSFFRARWPTPSRHRPAPHPPSPIVAPKHRSPSSSKKLRRWLSPRCQQSSSASCSPRWRSAALERACERVQCLDTARLWAVCGAGPDRSWASHLCANGLPSRSGPCGCKSFANFQFCFKLKQSF